MKNIISQLSFFYTKSHYFTPYLRNKFRALTQKQSAQSPRTYIPLFINSYNLSYIVKTMEEEEISLFPNHDPGDPAKEGHSPKFLQRATKNFKQREKTLSKKLKPKKGQKEILEGLFPKQKLPKPDPVTLPQSQNQAPFLGLESILHPQNQWWSHDKHTSPISTLWLATQTIAGDTPLKDNPMRYIFQAIETPDVLPLTYGWIATQGYFTGSPNIQIRIIEDAPTFQESAELVFPMPYDKALNKFPVGMEFKPTKRLEREKHLKYLNSSIVDFIWSITEYGHSILEEHQANMKKPFPGNSPGTTRLLSLNALRQLPQAMAREVAEVYLREINTLELLSRKVRKLDTTNYNRKRDGQTHTNQTQATNNNRELLANIRNFFNNCSYDTKTDEERTYPFEK
jgi:hypothetical protein